MADINQKINMSSIARYITLNITFTGVRVMNARIRLAKLLMLLVARIAGMQCNVVIIPDEPKTWTR